MPASRTRPRGHLTDTSGAIAVAAGQGTHGVLAERGQWVSNERTLIGQAGPRGIDDILTGLTPQPGHLLSAIEQATALLRLAD